MNFENLKMTALVSAYSAFRIPLLAFITPRIVELTDTRSAVRVSFGLRTRNHLGVMYFGALAMGAELSIALKVVQELYHSGKKIDFIFKDFQCEFLKRADGHVHFICDEAAAVCDFLLEAAQGTERHNKTFSGYAIVPAKSEEPIMKYKLTLSVKRR